MRKKEGKMLQKVKEMVYYNSWLGVSMLASVLV